MKIAMIGQKGIPSRAGGIEVHVEELAKRLVKMGCSIDVYCRRGYCSGREKTFCGIRTIFTPYLSSKSLEAISHTLFSVLHAIAEQNDIIHFHALGPSALAFLPRLFGIKVVCTVHGLDWKRSKWGRFSKTWLKFGEYATARFANRTISVSEALVDYYRQKYGKQIDFIANGIEVRERVPPIVIREKFGLEEGSFILFLGRLVPEKGVHYLIEAYKHAATDKKLVIAGGSSHSDKYEKQLHEMAAGDPGIIFTGFVQGELWAELLSNCYIYVLPSDIEGMPISLLEAMSYGKCCLVSDIEENKAVVSEYGYIFRQGDTGDLAEKIRFLAENGDLVYGSGDKTTDYIGNNFDWDISANKTYQLYKSLLK